MSTRNDRDTSGVRPINVAQVHGSVGALPNLDGGDYWIMVQDWLTGLGLDDVQLTTVVIPGTDNGNLTARAVRSVPAGTPFDITLSWNEPDLAVGDTWFALVEFGSSPAQPNNAGSLLVRINRQ